MKNKTPIYILGLVLIGVIAFVIFGMNAKTQPTSNKIQIVAAENFYADIATQLGGNHVSVLGILSDPNADPHEYESSVQDAKAVATATIVIENGLEYDTWMDKLLSASPNANRTLLIGGILASHPLPDNPHVWYGIDNIQAIAADITNALKKADPKDAAEYSQRLTAFDASLTPLMQKIADIHAKYSKIPIGLTETIYLYQSQPEGLQVLTSFAFEKAIAEGNDPSADDVAKANDQITSKQVKILIYNVQTITPITTNMQNEAKSENIPVVPVSETMPLGKHYQSWMLDQINTVEQALASTTVSR